VRPEGEIIFPVFAPQTPFQPDMAFSGFCRWCVNTKSSQIRKMSTKSVRNEHITNVLLISRWYFLIFLIRDFAYYLSKLRFS